MRRKEHDEITDQNYRGPIRGHSRKGKTFSKHRKYKRPSSKLLLKSSVRRFT